MDEESLASILPEPKVFNKPQAYQDLQALVAIYEKALKRSDFTYLHNLIFITVYRKASFQTRSLAISHPDQTNGFDLHISRVLPEYWSGTR